MKRTILCFVVGLFMLPCTLAAFDYPAPVLLSKWGGPGSAPGQILSPRAIAVNTSAFVYEADTSNDRIQKFDQNGKVYVRDRGNHRVQMFKSDGSFVMNWGERGSADGQFIQPVAIAIGPFEDIYVSDTVHHNIQRFRAHPLRYFQAVPVPSTSGF